MERPVTTTLNAPSTHRPLRMLVVTAPETGVRRAVPVVVVAPFRAPPPSTPSRPGSFPEASSSRAHSSPR
jgi:hypothetical protein